MSALVTHLREAHGIERQRPYGDLDGLHKSLHAAAESVAHHLHDHGESPPAAPVVSGDGGEALRREVERLCEAWEGLAAYRDHGVSDHQRGLLAAARALRDALSAAAAVRERREVQP